MVESIKMRKTVVVSAVNFTEGGPLTVLRESLAAASEVLPPEWDIVALVHDESLIRLPRVRTVAIPDAKISWLRRLRWEWFGFNKLSQQWEPELWLSLHDITPRVQARYQAVYCHNPAPFYRVRLRDILHEPKLLLFSLFYVGLYRLHIRRNRYVIVQQEWLRQEFLRRFGSLPLLVAHPSKDLSPKRGIQKLTTYHVFLYPALARVFKNLEVIGEAVNLLQARGIENFEVRLTIDGTENKYSKWLKRCYGQLPNLRFLGRQDSNQMHEQYKEASAMLFPSRLETWGLPITEAKLHQLPILVADLPYAHETVGEYDLVSFFDPKSPELLADLMVSIISGVWQPTGNSQRPPRPPFAAHWGELWALLVEDQANPNSFGVNTVHEARP
jgi:glycosyltransferase involved in cell wall biosynthesis